ncbi:hypothetical protein ACTVKO_23820 [Serratia nevei]|uniref:hypothetical protein n=1 Tax=Serratia nevei TaxID=2703794 RepID=UPI003FA7AEFF
MREHDELQKNSRSEDQWLMQTGTYEWTTETAQQEGQLTRITRLRQAGYAVEELSAAQLITRLPEVLPSPRLGRRIWHFPKESLLHPTVFLPHQWAETCRDGQKNIFMPAPGISLNVTTV